jgi:hypothetical protein
MEAENIKEPVCVHLLQALFSLRGLEAGVDAMSDEAGGGAALD